MSQLPQAVLDYRDEHNLSALFQELMTSLLQEQPDNPLRFLYRAIRRKVALNEGKQDRLEPKPSKRATRRPTSSRPKRNRSRFEWTQDDEMSSVDLAQREFEPRQPASIEALKEPTCSKKPSATVATHATTATHPPLRDNLLAENIPDAMELSPHDDAWRAAVLAQMSTVAWPGARAIDKQETSAPSLTAVEAAAGVYASPSAAAGKPDHLSLDAFFSKGSETSIAWKQNHETDSSDSDSDTPPMSTSSQPAGHLPSSRSEFLASWRRNSFNHAEDVDDDDDDNDCDDVLDEIDSVFDTASVLHV